MGLESDIQSIVTDSIWTHYRNGKEYMVSCLAENPNTAELVVVYWDAFHVRHVSVYYFRPLGEFLEKFHLKE